MERTLFLWGRKPDVLTRGLALTLCLALALPVFTVTPALGQAGGIITNGTTTQPNHIRADSQAAAGIPGNFFAAPGFLFEPESPYASLKSVPIWNEIEQLLDNPYAVTPDPITPGNFDGFPSYRSTIVRRPSFSAPGATLLNPGPPLPGFLVHPLNYNPTTGEEMRLLNSAYPGGPFDVPDELFQDLATDPTGNTWAWTYKNVQVSPGAGRVFGPEIDYNGPMKADPLTCVNNLELVPPEGTQLCGFDPGEPNYSGFGVLNTTGYSTPAVPGVASPGTFILATDRLYDPTRGLIQPRSPGTGAGGLRKPSLRVPEAGGSPSNPNYLANTNPDDVTPSNENDYYRPAGNVVAGIPTGRNAAIALGKALFWDMQVGSDGVQSCGTCHFTGAGTDTRTKNQINPNHLGGDLAIQLHGINAANQELSLADFPFHKLVNPDVAGDPACATPIVANVSAVTPALDHPVTGDVTVCDAANIVSDINDVASSMGVVFSPFTDIPAPGGGRGSAAFVQLPGNTPRPLMPDIRTAGALDPIPVFQGLRRVEPRNTPTMQAAGFNFDNFWDGRARHDFNGGSVFGAADPQSHVFANDGTAGGPLTATRQIIRFASIASLATGPALSEFEMSFAGRNWQKIGKKLLQNGVVPLANQLVDPTDSVLGPYSGQRSTVGGPVNQPGRPGLNQSYEQLIQAAFYPQLWANKNQHLDGSPTAPAPGIPILGSNGSVTTAPTDPFDGFVLSAPQPGGADPASTNQFSQMEANFSLFWGLGVHMWVQILVPDNTPFDQFLDANPGAFQALGEPGEPGLVEGQLNCGSPGADPNYCFKEVGNFKRDPGVVALRNATAENGAGAVAFPAGGTRPAGATDPLLGLDIFFASNLSLKNPNFRTARCGECHAVPTLTDHTVVFTSKGQLRDFVAEFLPGQPGNETIIEPLGRNRVISGFLLESEFNENGQDGVERRIINQSIVPNPVDGLAYPDATAAGLPGFGPWTGAGASFFDNGMYNLGVRPINDDLGRGGNDAFGWPLSLAALMMKNLGGPSFEPGVPLPTFVCSNNPCDPVLDATGGLFEETAQDQQINPGFEGNPLNPLLPPYLAAFANNINVGDAMPELDEVFGGLNTLTDVAILEGFLDTLGPFNPAGVLNESLNYAESELMGTWPVVNRVGRMGSFKAPQLRNVELTGPYFHNGGLATLRQVVDFYVRGGDFPMTNAAHRDFNLVNMNIEVQSNLTEAEKVALVDFLLELTDERVRFQRAPFDHPEVIIPVDGTAPDNTVGRAALLADSRFRDIPAVGAAGTLLSLGRAGLSLGSSLPRLGRG